LSSLTDIANKALSHIGQGDEIQNFDTDDSKEATACRRFMQDAIDATLTDFDWPFAQKTVTLDLVSTDPTTEWPFAYRYPADCLTFKRFIIGERNLTPENIVPFKIMADGAGQLIYCDINPAIGQYTAKVTNTELFPSLLVLGLSYMLASLIAPRITAGDEFGASKRCLALAMSYIQAAKANVANEAQADKRPESEFIRTRQSEASRFGVPPFGIFP